MMRLSDIGLTPGGQAVANARAWNALANDMLVNRYYGPNMQSQIDYRNAGTNRLNTMTPLEAQQLQIENQYRPEKLRLANELARLTNQNYTPNIQSEIGLRNAERDQINALLPSKKAMAELKAKYPLMGMDGVAGQIGGQMFLDDWNKSHQQNSLANTNATVNGYNYTPIPNNSLNQSPQPQVNNSGYGNAIIDALNARTKGTIAKAQLAQMQAGNQNWSQLPVETRSQYIAQGAGAGLDPNEIRDRVNKGMTMRQIYEEQGLDPDNPPPSIYPQTTATKTANQKTAAVSAELGYLNSQITQAIKPYADRFAGLTEKEFADQFSNDVEAQKQYGRYRGAITLMNELSSGRLNLAGARSSVQLSRDLTKKTMAGFTDVLPKRMTSHMFEAMQNFIEEKLQKAAKIRTSYGLQQFGANPNKTDSKPDYDQSDLEYTAKKYNMTVDQVKQRLGYK